MQFISTVTGNASTDNSVATSQTPGAAGNLTLVSSSVSFGTNSAQYVTVVSTANLSNRTFTITGTDIYDKVFSQTVTGPNNGTTTSTLAFKTVTNVAISGAAAGALTVGNSAYAEGQMYPCDTLSNPFSVGFGCIITSGTPTFTVQHTYDNVLATGNSSPLGITGPDTTAYTYSSTSNTWFNHSSVASKSANTDGSYSEPVNAIKLTLSAAGAVKIIINQGGEGAR